MSFLQPSIESRKDCQAFGIPTGPEPPKCWSCDKPVGELYIYTADGPECSDCTKLGAETLKAELGMSVEEFINESTESRPFAVGNEKSGDDVGSSGRSVSGRAA